MENEFTSVGTCRGVMFALVPSAVLWAAAIAMVLHLL